MSTTTPPPAPLGVAATRSLAGSQPTSTADGLIADRIAESCRALWWAEIIRNCLRMVIVTLGVILLWAIVDQWIYSPGVAVRTITWLCLAAWAVWYVARRIVPVLRKSVQPEYAARALERDIPELKQELTSYVSLRGEANSKGLRSRVVRSLGMMTAGKLRSHDALPTEATGTLSWWIGTAGALALLVGYAILSPKSTVESASRLVAPISAIEPAKRVSIRDVKPGDVETIAGRAVAVSAEVEGLRDDERVWCRWETANQEHEFELNYDDANMRFAGKLQLDHNAAGQVPYYLHAGDDEVGPFYLTVENVPVVALQSVHYQPPAYTGEVPHTSSSGAITAVDGSVVTILAKTNREISRASIEFNPRLLGETVRATAGSQPMQIDTDQKTLSISFPLRSTHGRSAAVQFEAYRIRVWDAADQANPEPIVYPIRIIADLSPEISIVLPRKSPKSMAVDLQQIIEVHAMDPDFGLKQVELEIRRGIDVIKQPILWKDEAGEKGNQVTEYRFRPSEHGLHVGDVVEIVAIATDNRHAPDDDKIEANVTRTDSIELRIVEEQSQPPANDPAQDQTADDGLSQPDQRPPTDHQDDADGEKSGSQSGDQQGSGAGGQGDSGGQQQSGEGSGEGNGGGEGQADPAAGEQPTAENSGENQSGSGGGQSSGDQPPSEQQTGDQQSGEMNPNQSGDQGAQSGTQSESQSGQGGQPSEGSQGGNDPSDADPSGQQPNNQNQGAGDENNSDSSDPSGGQEAGQENGGQPNAGQESGGSSGEGMQGSEATGGQQVGDQNNAGGSQPQGDSPTGDNGANNQPGSQSQSGDPNNQNPNNQSNGASENGAGENGAGENGKEDPKVHPNTMAKRSREFVTT